MFKWSVLLLSPLAAISSKNWIIMWSFLELSSFIFIIFLMKEKKSDLMLNYFLIQSISSAMLLLSLCMKNETTNFYEDGTPMSNILLISSLMAKSGLIPLHMWMMELTRKMKSKNLFIFLTFQKMAPIFILMKNSEYFFLFFIIITNNFIGVMSQLSSINLNELLTLSSITHSSWMLLTLLMSSILFWFYFCCYTTIIFLILKEMKNKNLKNLSSMYSKNIYLFVNLLSLSGIPPLLGFLPKWYTIMIAMKSKEMLILSTFMVIMGCINTFIYIRLTTMKIMNKPFNSKQVPKSPLSNPWSITLNLSPWVLMVFFEI